MAFVNAAPFNLTLFTSSSIQKRSDCEPVFTTRTTSHAPVAMGLSRRELLRNLTQVASTAILAMLPAPFPNHVNSAKAAMYSAETAPSFQSNGDPSKLST